MQNARIYIVQVTGIILLLCGYFLSDQPDELSVMHFDSRAHSVISQPTKSALSDLSIQTLSSSQNDGKQRINAPKYVSFEFLIPQRAGYIFLPGVSIEHGAPLHENYAYLFYKEINPPPPKCC